MLCVPGLGCNRISCLGIAVSRSEYCMCRARGQNIQISAEAVVLGLRNCDRLTVLLRKLANGIASREVQAVFCQIEVTDCSYWS